MSWSRRYALLAFVAAAGCGFRPALGPGSGAGALRGDIAFEAPTDRSGYALLRRLEERLGLPSRPTYDLRLTITEDTETTGVPRNQVTARANLIGVVGYSLVHLPTSEVVRRGQVQSFAGYSSSSTTAASQAAREDARERLMTLLADRIVSELMATADTWRR